MKRRSFVKTLSQTGVLLSTAGWMTDMVGAPETVKLTILHTNDVHSRVEPFPDDAGRNAGLGGAARRAALIQRIRSEEDHVLLLDAGDIFQGTPYYNFFGGEIELKLMSEMKYDAATIGNHDFDGGIDGLKDQLPNANFPLLISNYDFTDTIMDGQTKPYKIFNKGDIKIGVFGLGIELESLVPKALYKETRYLDPIEKAKKTSKHLKNEMKCDYVICLSHLGYNYKYEDKVDDHAVAKMTTDIDMIIGGHTHTFLPKPEILSNADGEPVVVNQVGWGGMYLGRVDVFFERSKSRQCSDCKNIPVSG